MFGYVWSQECSECGTKMFSMNNWNDGKPICKKCVPEAEN